MPQSTPLTFMPGYQEARERMRAEVNLPPCLIALMYATEFATARLAASEVKV